MHPVQIVIFLLLNSALKNINGVSSVNDESPLIRSEIQIPKGLTVEQHVRTTDDFWTDERLRAAIPKSLERKASVLIDENSADKITSDENEKPTLIQGTAPASFISSRTPGYPNTVGKVYFMDGSLAYSCTASVVTADNKDMIFTAGHCVFSEITSSFVSSFIFIPQHDYNTRPYGTWTARYLHAIQNWASYFDLSSDIGMVLLFTLNNKHIQDVVGSHPVGFNFGHSATVYSFGYPINYYSAQVMTYCTGTKYFANYSSYTGDALPCTMNQGCSGGPWFESFSTSTLSGVQTSINSFTRNATPNVMYGPYFDSYILAMYYSVQGTTSKVSSVVNHCFFSPICVCLLVVLQKYFQKGT